MALAYCVEVGSRQPRGLASSLPGESTLPVCPDPASGDHSGNGAA